MHAVYAAVLISWYVFLKDPQGIGLESIDNKNLANEIQERVNNLGQVFLSSNSKQRDMYDQIIDSVREFI